MGNETINFPIYRKYKNNKSYFKITALDNFQEIKIVGKLFMPASIQANLYPEKLLIRQLIDCEVEGAVEITAQEYAEIATKAGLE